MLSNPIPAVLLRYLLDAAGLHPDPGYVVWLDDALIVHWTLSVPGQPRPGDTTSGGTALRLHQRIALPALAVLLTSRAEDSDAPRRPEKGSWSDEPGTGRPITPADPEPGSEAALWASGRDGQVRVMQPRSRYGWTWA
jgi:hypothetical protein